MTSSSDLSRLQPPGSTEPVEASSVLVIAPHFDDEVLGCGGLLGRLTARGVPVRVLFLSDGAGGVEGVEDPTEYAARRRREAEEAAEVLGISRTEALGLPDGRLARHLSEIRRALARSWATFRPDLVLAPGPLEVSPDHRAAFRALFDLVHPLRPGAELWDPVQEARILLYEVNHPAYPDLLVDVGDQVELLERAMECYESQQERHDYLGAALGLRRYRALSLPPEIEAVEGYRRLSAEELVGHSFSRLILSLGGAPDLVEVDEGPPVSVVVRTRNRPGRLREALESLASSRHRALEVVVVNDGGSSPGVPDGYPFPVRTVELSPGRGRGGAANAGVEAASHELVGFLDDDDLVYPEHFGTLTAALGAADVDVAYTDAAVVRYELVPEGGWEEVERRVPYSRDFDRELLLVDNYIPFNTLLFRRSRLLEAGPFDEELPFFEDWDLLIRLSRIAELHHVPGVTCEYRHFHGGDQVFGQSPRGRRDFLAVKGRVMERHRSLLDAEGLARVVDRLRSEAVEAREAARSWKRDREDARRELAAARDRSHRLHGEVVSLRGDLDRTRDEADRLGSEAGRLREELEDRDRTVQELYDREARLRETLEDQEEHLGRTYAEIERLRALLEEMRSTRAWRVHEWWERWRR